MENLLRPRYEGDVRHIEQLDPEQQPAGSIRRYWLHMSTDALSLPIQAPVLMARGKMPGPVLGITAAVHGNEINGISVIQRLFREIDVEHLRGVIIGVLVVNVPSYLHEKRRFVDEADLNRIMPGKPDGNVSEVYAHRIKHRILQHFDYLVDLHTASFGRVNSYYIRADMDDLVTRKMALLQNAQIIVHNPPSDHTVRGTADEMRIPAITLEVGNPHVFQKGLIRSGLTGIHNLLSYLKMIDGPIEPPEVPPVVCRSSFWMYTDTGGILSVHPKLVERVRKGQLVATIRNVFGEVIQEYNAPADGIVVGKSVDPINQTGGRILHLGITE